MTTLAPTHLFDRVVCGVDRSEAGIVAARAAALLTDPAGSLTVVSATDASVAVHAGWGMKDVLEKLAADATAALEEAEAAARPLHELETKLVAGDPLRALRAEIERRDASVVVAGSHEHARATGIALGSVATHLLHEAPCSVLIARGNVTGHWPSLIVVGVDGSEDSARAYQAARELAERRGSRLRAVVATRDRGVDLQAARAIVPDLEEHESRALDLLTVFSGPSDLVVVGSRGLKGLRALGSLSERLAHETRSSVLVVRRRA